MAHGGKVEVPPNFVPLDHVQRAMKNADCRTPVIFFLKDGDPYMSLCKIANETQSAVWLFDASNKHDSENMLGYIEIGTNNGDWVLITNCGSVGQHLFRDIALMIFCLRPEPRKHPRREFFRCVFCVEREFCIDDSVGVPFPPLILKNSIVARVVDNASKWSIRLPSESTIREVEDMKRERRRQEGRDSDDETDLDEDELLSGKWFHRAVELNKAVDEAPLTLAQEEMRMALDAEDLPTIKRLIESGEIDIEREIKVGMTPLQYACSVEKAKSVACLLECGANPNKPRRSDGRPPLFMALDDISIVESLVAHGADLFAKYEGYRVDSHPDTLPEVSKMVKKLREEM
ncbi:putative Ankyrin repeats (3 copies) Ankyrin repeat [Trypanosoma vivax]|uniref:Uncharacterized protein n=1 Tax=Trypanosoma vivax (strain Y486) TaxID=1055687 RepID=G0U2P4_TRYVY|nr:hypothetical protein TRVL_02265 [Trypanosoma vivax]KAH8604286.1 putative Ankyrin repeats (3 copies) Ankyrin repeat [Trypanosoma vivax]CCC50547.1 conserved hypothetical protein [Trypanosoma vivax Y486]